MKRKKAKTVLFITTLLFSASCSPVHFEFQESAMSASTSDPLTGEDKDGGDALAAVYGPTHTASSTLRLIDRVTVASILNQRFGPTAVSYTNALVKAKVNQYGGPCDQNMVTETVNASGTVTVTNDCSDGAHSQSMAPMVAVSSSGREGLRIRVCDRIVAQDATILYAAKEVQPDLTKANAKIPTPEQVISMYQQFSPGVTPTEEIQEKLAAISARTQQLNLIPFEAWRFIYLTLCLSPDWQIP
jgi:hypothetical protein